MSPHCLRHLQAGRPYKSFFKPPPVRAARAREGAPDLAHPAFSSCTLPIVWLPLWQENFAHAYMRERRAAGFVSYGVGFVVCSAVMAGFVV